MPAKAGPLKGWPQRLLSAFAVCFPWATPLLSAMLAQASTSWPDSGLNAVSRRPNTLKPSPIGRATLIPTLDCSMPLSATVD